MLTFSYPNVFILIFSVHCLANNKFHLYCWSFLSDNLGEDCPVFDNLFEFCQMYAGGTIGNMFIVETWNYRDLDRGGIKRTNVIDMKNQLEKD